MQRCFQQSTTARRPVTSRRADLFGGHAAADPMSGTVTQL